MMQTLSPVRRKHLERTVVRARDNAEEGARAALEALAVGHHEPYGHMSAEQRALRRRLRAHGRQIGDRLDGRTGQQGIEHLVQECAYEHWHGMLFARFLAENDLLIEPEMEIAISLDECEELAKEEGLDKWLLAARFAHHMLPQVFRPDHPVFEVQFAREYRLKLEGLVEELPAEVFAAKDSLGWVYQFWQTKKKDEVNRSEVKIGADELPAVTQLFTEPYMVQFLLHNSLGAWWVSRHPERSCPIDLTYLRRTEDGAPAAGTFEGWPESLSEFRLLDPCCGSGHFLVAAFLMLVPMRMVLEGHGATDAVDAVFRENLHGLELDQRCVAIAAFALALEAWRYAGASGYRPLPKFNLAWCGQPVTGKREQWLALAEGDSRLEVGMTALYDTFRDAPVLGSLIDPARSVAEDMFTAGFAELEPLLGRALQEHAGDEDWEETAIAARGLVEAGRLLAKKYQLVTTNVPYLGIRKQGVKLRSYLNSCHRNGRHDLAAAFVERLFSLCARRGIVAAVAPQTWLLIQSYKSFREQLLSCETWRIVALLGSGAFDSISGEVVKPGLFTFENVPPSKNDSSFAGLDANSVLGAAAKAKYLSDASALRLSQSGQLANPDSRVIVHVPFEHALLDSFAASLAGIQNGDSPRFLRKFWELSVPGARWAYLQSAVTNTCEYGGLDTLIDYDKENGHLRAEAQWRRSALHDSDQRGKPFWGMRGIAVSRMGDLPCALYIGGLYDQASAVIVPNNPVDLPAIWSYCSSKEYVSEVRKIDLKLNVTSATLVKVPIDIERWREVAAKRYPDVLPQPYSRDPTQWIFHGHPSFAEPPLQITVARLLGYRWPAENDPDMELADEQREWVARAKRLYPYEDEDGIVCIPSVRGERPAAERLLELLHVAYGDEWHDGTPAKLLSESGGSSLEEWLRNKFFEQHCKLFHHRPFIWHIWDGRKRDGFHALVNYHKLAEGDGKGRRLLESLTYSYLGDWIARQEDGVKRGEGGAEDRLAAALELQKCLVAIIEGEPPFDIFVRWKPIEELPIGWEPDINDGVRLNIRPFMAQDIPGGKKGAGILRAKPNIKWSKDRGKEPMREQEQFPWFWNDGEFTGERVNEIHLTNAEKKTARERAEGKQ